MHPFEFILTLVSFIYALALTHLLSRIGALIQARDRVRFSALQALMMLNAGMQVFVSWLFGWDFRNVTAWDLTAISLSFLYAVSVYLLCAVAAPEFDDGEIDLEHYYWHNRRIFWGLFALFTTLALSSNFIALKTPTPALFLQATLVTLPNFIPCLIGFASPARWAQWVAGLGIFATTGYFLLTFAAVLR